MLVDHILLPLKEITGCREIWRNICVLILAVCHPGSHWRWHYCFSMARAGHMGGDVFIIISCRELVRVSSSAAEYVWTFVPFSTFLWAVETLFNQDMLESYVSYKCWDLRKRPQEMNFSKEKKIELENYDVGRRKKVVSSGFSRKGLLQFKHFIWS